jgi:hypothetical protein
MGRKFGFSFSLKRATGISGAKNRLSRKIGVPLTRSGRQRKFGRAAGCFIATAVYENSNAPEVQLLRRFRNSVLLKSAIGRFTVSCYYWVGPILARMANKVPILKLFFRVFLDRFVQSIKQ